MAEYKFNVTGAERKALVSAVSEILDEKVKYCGMPTANYEVGAYIITKYGALVGDCDMGLLAALEDRGFEYSIPQTFHLLTPRGNLIIEERFDTAAEAERAGFGYYFDHDGRGIYTRPNGKGEYSIDFAMVGEPFEPKPRQDHLGIEAKQESEPDDPENGSEQMPEPDPEKGSEPNHLTISVPRTGFDPPAIDRLVKMVLAKEALLKQALGADDLPIHMEAQEIMFPWFSGELDGETVEAYTLFITALTETAKRKKRVTAKPIDTANPKFSLRVWLISLGMVGEKYRLSRSLLCKNLPGDSSWRFGKPDKTVAVAAAETGGEPDVV